MSNDVCDRYTLVDRGEQFCVRCGRSKEEHKRTAHVIMVNDSVQCVVLGSEEEAKGRVEVEREAYYQHNRMSWNTNALYKPAGTEEADRKAYTARCYWHIRTVPLY